MSATAQSIGVRERTGGVDRTRYEIFRNVLIHASQLVPWLTPDEVATSVRELIEAGLDDRDPRRIELCVKLIATLTKLVEEEENVMTFDDEPIHSETLQFIDRVIGGGQEAA